jgi:ribosomal protein S19E (S16A)
MLKLEVFDLSDKGDSTPYFRRQMSILNKVLAKQGIPAEKILGEFSKDEIEIPYPALNDVLVEALNEELELMGYLEIKDGKAFVTPSGQTRLQAFKKSLSPEERTALNM